MARVVKMGETRAKRSLIRVNKSSCPAVVGGLSSPSNFWLYRSLQNLSHRTNLRRGQWLDIPYIFLLFILDSARTISAIGSSPGRECHLSGYRDHGWWSPSSPTSHPKPFPIHISVTHWIDGVCAWIDGFHKERDNSSRCRWAGYSFEGLNIEWMDFSRYKQVLWAWRRLWSCSSKALTKSRLYRRCYPAIPRRSDIQVGGRYVLLRYLNIICSLTQATQLG